MRSRGAILIFPVLSLVHIQYTAISNSRTPNIWKALIFSLYITAHSRSGIMLPPITKTSTIINAIEWTDKSQLTVNAAFATPESRDIRTTLPEKSVSDAPLKSTIAIPKNAHIDILTAFIIIASHGRAAADDVFFPQYALTIPKVSASPRNKYPIIP